MLHVQWVRNRAAGRALVAIAFVLGAGRLAVAQCQVTKVNASDPVENAEFGFAALDGAVLVVGAAFDLTGVGAGAAYVYRFDGTSWPEEAKLVASDGEPGDRFGSVAVSGDVILVGAYRDDDAGTDAGAAYVFRRNVGVWAEEAKLVPAGLDAGDWFGIIPDIAGEWALIAATSDDDAGEDAGAVYVYRHVGASWVETQKLVAADGAAGDGFGYPVSISPCGRVAVIGASGQDAAGEDAGAAYVYRLNDGTWIFEAKLTASDAAPGDGFAIAARIDESVLVAGAFDDDGGQNAGAAYVFRYAGTTWSEEAKLVASDAEAGDFFAADVTVRGDLIVATAPLDDDGGADAGAAYIFRRDGAMWVQEAKLTASDPGEDDWFANSVALAGDHLAVAARFDDDGGTDTGSAYVFAGLAAVDYNDNGIADVCEALCPADTDGDRTVDFQDLLRLLSDWGPCP